MTWGWLVDHGYKLTTNHVSHERRNSHKGGCRKKDANNTTAKIHGYTLDASTWVMWLKFRFMHFLWKHKYDMIQDTSVTLLLRSQNIHVEFAPN